MKYNKQPLDIPAQIAMLKGRGLNIADEQAAEKALNTISHKSSSPEVSHG